MNNIYYSKNGVAHLKCLDPKLSNPLLNKSYRNYLACVFLKTFTSL